MNQSRETINPSSKSVSVRVARRTVPQKNPAARTSLNPFSEVITAKPPLESVKRNNPSVNQCPVSKAFSVSGTVKDSESVHGITLKQPSASQEKQSVSQSV